MKNWKTTALGAGLAALMIGPQIAHCIQGQPCDWFQVMQGILYGAFGYHASDK